MKIHGSDNGGKTAAPMANFVAWCRRLRLIPFAHLRDLRGRIMRPTPATRDCRSTGVLPKKIGDRITRAIDEHQIANENCLEEGVHLLELARRAHGLFERQEPREKRRLLNFVLANSAWKNGKLVAEFRQPFDMPYVANQTSAVVEAKAGGSGADFENWLPG